MGAFSRIHLRFPHHGMEEWLLMQGFYYGLTQKDCEHLDATTRGSFLSLTLGKAETLMDNIAENQSWTQGNIQHCHQSEEIPEEVKVLSTKMDVLLSSLDQRAKYKEDQRAIEETYKQSTTIAVRKLPHQPRYERR